MKLEAGGSLANDDEDDDEAVAASANTRTPDQTNKNSITGFISVSTASLSEAAGGRGLEAGGRWQSG